MLWETHDLLKGGWLDGIHGGFEEKSFCAGDKDNEPLVKLFENVAEIRTCANSASDGLGINCN